MKKFISTLLCIVFVAALMPAQIAKADSDVMSVANQVKVPILNEQTYNNKKLMNKYTTEDLVDAVNSFKSGSYSNSKGIYDGLMFIRKNQNESLIRSYYPSLPTHNEPIIK